VFSDQHQAEILLAQPRGFCAGVDRAIAVVEHALKEFGAPIYVRHEIVHNAYVVNDLQRRGAIFVESLEEIPVGSTVVFSAHGVSQAVRSQAEQYGLRVFDATCPLVTKVHVEVKKMHAEGYEIVMIGHRGHPEVEGTMGQLIPDPSTTEIASSPLTPGIHLIESLDEVEQLSIAQPEKVAYVTQTTLSVDDTQHIIEALQARFPTIRGPKKPDICYATQNRQDAVRFMAPQCDVVIVVGSPNSSNSNRLREVALHSGVEAYQVDAPEQIDPQWINGKKHIGVTAGASAPEALVQSVVERLRTLGARRVRNLEGVKETTTFPLSLGTPGNAKVKGTVKTNL
jgi:4-hydroxy-3-methylbut-2-enyl diphosphate reductase